MLFIAGIVFAILAVLSLVFLPLEWADLTKAGKVRSVMYIVWSASFSLFLLTQAQEYWLFLVSCIPLAVAIPLSVLNLFGKVRLHKN